MLFALSFSYSQSIKTSIDTLDLKFERNYVSIDEVLIYQKNADKVDVPIRFSLSIPDSIYNNSKITIKKLNRMIMTAHYSAMYSCKNKYTFVPKEMRLWYYSKYNVLDVDCKFTAQNDYGATKDGNDHVMFDINGDKEVSMYDMVMKEKEEEKKKTEEEKKKKRRSRQW